MVGEARLLADLQARRAGARATSEITNAPSCIVRPVSTEERAEAADRRRGG
jgi:hypothetical protein